MGDVMWSGGNQLVWTERSEAYVRNLALSASHNSCGANLAYFHRSGQFYIELGISSDVRL